MLLPKRCCYRTHKQVNIFLKPEVKNSVILAANFHRHVPTVHCLTNQIYLPDPEGISDYIASPIMCSVSTVYRSLVESSLKAGNWAVFPDGGGDGGGGVGIQGVQLAKALGLRPSVVDTGAAKRDLALEMGTEAFVDFEEVPDATAEVIKIADGKGAHGVFVTAPAAYSNAISYTDRRVGAIVMCIGFPSTGTTTIGADPGSFCFKNLTVKGTLVGSMRDTDIALDFAKRWLLRQICEIYPIDKMSEAVEKLRKGKVAGRCVVD